MAVYVDDMAAPFGNMVMYHCWADTLEELLEMMDRIGVQRKWIQGHPTLSFGKHRNASWVHFDISKAKRELAVHAGAIETDRYGPLYFNSQLHALDPIPEIRDMGLEWLRRIQQLRESRNGL